ncbi:MAG: peptidylprolyl isomerase [Verrucomicrobiales bacterium]|nr:peptidylprolyl isomerase [Verrucomicrobiales bacterium]
MLLALCAGVVSCSAQEAKSDSKSDAKKEETKEPKKADPTPSKSEEVAVIKTSLGEMVVEFWPDVAPKTVENFKNLAKTNFYDGTLFHRIIKGFMIQGGDPNTKKAGMESQWGMGGPGYGVKAEFNPRKHTRGVLSMARSNDPNSAGSQFFICLGDAGFLDGKYTAFGKVIKGDDVLEKLGNTKVGPGNTGDQQDSRPVDRVSLDSIRIVPASSAK